MCIADLSGTLWDNCGLIKMKIKAIHQNWQDASVAVTDLRISLVSACIGGLWLHH